MPAHATTSKVNPIAEGSETSRPWLGVQFVCANQYRRIYRSVNGAEYLARCPSCSKCVRFRVAQGGSDQRFYEIDCR